MKSPAKNPVDNLARNPAAGHASLQQGLSLIELMISITIGLLILASLSTLFVNQSKTRVELDKSNRMIDNGRYALEVLSDNLKLAGFYGAFSPTSGVPAIPASLPDPCSLDPAVMSASLQLAVQGYDANTPTSQIASPPCGFTYTPGDPLTLKPGSDILALRRASTATPIVASAALANTHYIQVSLCQYDDEAVPYIISTTPANFTLRQKGCAPATTPLWSSTTTYALNEAVKYSGITYFSLAGGNLNNTPSTTIGTWWNVSSGALADLRNFYVEVYFVSPNNNTNPPDGIPTLKRYEIDKANPSTNKFVVTPLVEGVEYMQIEYGLDTDNDGSPDSYVVAPAATAWPNVVAVKMHILARNTEPTSGYTDTKTYDLGVAGSVTPNDNYKRHVYTQFIRLVNPAGRRE